MANKKTNIKPIKKAPVAAKGKPPKYVVDIGASMGGTSAIKNLLKNQPPSKIISYVLVMHISQTHKSHLAKILGQATNLRAAEARNLAPLREEYNRKSDGGVTIRIESPVSEAYL